MFDNTSYQKEKNLFSIVNKQYKATRDEHHLFCRPQDLINWIQVVKEDLNYIYFIDAVALLNPSNTPYDFELDIIVANLESHQRLHLHVQFYKDEIIPSIVNFYPSSLYALREQRDLFDIKFDIALDSLFLTEKNRNIFSEDWKKNEEAKPFTAPKLPYNPNKSERPYPQESWRWSHGDLFSRKTLGKFEAYYCFDPFKVVDVRTRLGSNFRGIEFELAHKDHMHITYLLEHMNNFASPFYSAAWAINLEQVLELEITERAKGLRIVLWELSRIAEHLFITYEMCHLLELNESLFYLDAYERVCELFEAFSGNRYGQGIIKVGGLNVDIPAGWIIEFQEFNKIFLKNITLYHQYLLANSKFRTLINHTKVSSYSVLQNGISGPNLRAAGVNYDLRKSRPVYFYQDIDFDVPVGVNGTSFDRYLIRFEEMIQSSRIITQVLDNLPLGLIDLEIGQTEWINQLKQKNNEFHYFALEAPNGETGIVYAQGRNAEIKRLKVKSPSLNLTQGLNEFLRGIKEAEVSVALASLGIREREMER